MIRTDGQATFDSHIEGRLDAITPNTSVFFARQLESIEARVFEFKKRELKYREFIPVSNRDSPGAETITYHIFDRVGMAQVISNYADDLPRADVFGQEFTQPVKSLGIAVGWSTQEIRAAALVGVDLDGMKADAQRRGLREKENRIAWTGDPDSGLLGFLTNPNIPVLAAPTGTSGFTWLLKTADEILNDVRLSTSQIRDTSRGVFEADTMLLPQGQFDIIAGRARSATSDVTILQFIRNNVEAYGITTIGVLNGELDNAFTGGTEDGAAFYERTPEVLENRIPMELQLMPVETRGLEFIINGEARNGGVVVRYPLACLFLTGI